MTLLFTPSIHSTSQIWFINATLSTCRDQKGPVMRMLVRTVVRGILSGGSICNN